MNNTINPEIIKWARERSGYSIEDLAFKLKKDPKELYQWESGDRVPTYTCVEKLAYKYFKIPLAVFFFPSPPIIEDPINKFRRLPQYELARFSSDTLQIIRLMQGYQDSLIELIKPNEIGKQIFKDLKKDIPEKLAQNVRVYIGITIEKQYKFKSPEEAFKAWRRSLEESGIYTFKDSFKDRFISGFCLLDEIFPVICINNSNSFTRQIFTLAHELGHILYEKNGITDIDETYISYMNIYDKNIESKCNRFATEYLVPKQYFLKEIDSLNSTKPDLIPKIAEKFSVSREVILRKFLDHGFVDMTYYQKKSKEWNEDYLRNYKDKGGGDYYNTLLSYLGENFTQLAFSKYYSGDLSKIELATHLNMNSKNIEKLEQYFKW